MVNSALHNVRSLIVVASLAALFRYFQQHQQQCGIGQSTGQCLVCFIQRFAYVTGAGARDGELHTSGMRQVVVLQMAGSKR